MLQRIDSKALAEALTQTGLEIGASSVLMCSAPVAASR